MNEFEIIKNFFAKQSVERPDVVVGIGDDGAVVEVPAGNQLVVSTDTLISGVHFPLNTPAFDIAYKALAVNLSDLAAMGAKPSWFTLSLTLPNADKSWLEEFSKGLFDLASQNQIQLIGGDLTHGSLSISIQTLGFVPKNQAIKRNTARPGDLIYVSNTLGNAALGLLVWRGKFHLPKKFHDFLYTHLFRPEPQIKLGETLREFASSAIDISDGLAADLSHILEMSQVGAKICVDDIPLSPALSDIPPERAIDLALNGGDDYELCITVPPEKKTIVNKSFTCIGQITSKKDFLLRFKNGEPYHGAIGGYKHF